MEPEPPGAAFFTLEPEPESAPGPWPPGAGAAQKSGGSATLPWRLRQPWFTFLSNHRVNQISVVISDQKLAEETGKAFKKDKKLTKGTDIIYL